MCAALYWDESVKRAQSLFQKHHCHLGQRQLLQICRDLSPWEEKPWEVLGRDTLHGLQDNSVSAAETKPALKPWLHHSVPSLSSHGEVGWWVQGQQELCLAMSTQAHKTCSSWWFCLQWFPSDLGPGTLPRLCWYLGVLQVDVYLLFPGQWHIAWLLPGLADPCWLWQIRSDSRLITSVPSSVCHCSLPRRVKSHS